MPKWMQEISGSDVLPMEMTLDYDDEDWKLNSVQDRIYLVREDVACTFRLMIELHLPQEMILNELSF